MEDILVKKNPWEGEICGRKNCLICETKEKDEKVMKKNCSKRNLVYKTWCQTCLIRDIKRKEKGKENHGEKGTTETGNPRVPPSRNEKGETPTGSEEKVVEGENIEEREKENETENSGVVSDGKEKGSFPTGEERGKCDKEIHQHIYIGETARSA